MVRWETESEFLAHGLASLVYRGKQQGDCSSNKVEDEDLRLYPDFHMCCGMYVFPEYTNEDENV